MVERERGGGDTQIRVWFSTPPPIGSEPEKLIKSLKFDVEIVNRGVWTGLQQLHMSRFGVFSSSSGEVKGRIPQTDNQQEKWNRPTDHESNWTKKDNQGLSQVYRRHTGKIYGKNSKFSNGFAFSMFSSCLHWSHVHHTSHHDAILIWSRFTHVSIPPLSAIRRRSGGDEGLGSRLQHCGNKDFGLFDDFHVQFFASETITELCFGLKPLTLKAPHDHHSTLDVTVFGSSLSRYDGCHTSRKLSALFNIYFLISASCLCISFQKVARSYRPRLANASRKRKVLLQSQKLHVFGHFTQRQRIATCELLCFHCQVSLSLSLFLSLSLSFFPSLSL